MIAIWAAGYMVLEPIAPGSVVNGSLFLDSTNSNYLSYKDEGGVITVLVNVA